MKKLSILLIALFGMVQAVSAQKPMASPAETVSGKINGATITINYGSPSVKGREIWGKLVPFDKVWRAGANEATTFETDKQITVEGMKLAPGKYSLFVIPNEKQCTIIFNKVAKQWGAYDYKEKEDELRIKVAAKTKTNVTEKLLFELSADGAALVWEKWTIGFGIK